ncbi:unnamed protein product [Allacma fusca]|uniref:Uncharacterized protein n=1 Tax=Allacma fusca TaxID=39272 RepID=A0A8J2KFB8_9HEXA|nr:unnamed protein product [Allacma fusca]
MTRIKEEVILVLESKIKRINTETPSLPHIQIPLKNGGRKNIDGRDSGSVAPLGNLQELNSTAIHQNVNNLHSTGRTVLVTNLPESGQGTFPMPKGEGQTFLNVITRDAKIDNMATVVKQDTTLTFKGIAADEETSDSLLDENENLWDFRTQLERMKPRVRLHITLFSVSVGIVVLTLVVIFVNFRKSDSSNEDIFPVSKSKLVGRNNTRTELELFGLQTAGAVSHFRNFHYAKW